MSEEKKEVKKVEEVDTSKMNLFTKLQRVRAELQTKNITKSGLNKFSGFSYFELSDFLPAINELCAKYNLFTYADINSNTARITALDCDNPEFIFTLTMDTAEVELKGMNKIQGIGSQNTYMRRYLYMSLFEISESDTLDAITGEEDEDKPKKATKKATKPKEEDGKAELKKLCTELSKNGKKDDVQEVLERVAKVKNPNSITDEAKIKEALDELKKIEA